MQGEQSAAHSTQLLSEEEARAGHPRPHFPTWSPTELGALVTSSQSLEKPLPELSWLETLESNASTCHLPTSPGRGLREAAVTAPTDTPRGAGFAPMPLALSSGGPKGDTGRASSGQATTLGSPRSTPHVRGGGLMSGGGARPEQEQAEGSCSQPRRTAQGTGLCRQVWARCGSRGLV